MFPHPHADGFSRRPVIVSSLAGNQHGNQPEPSRNFGYSNLRGTPSFQRGRDQAAPVVGRRMRPAGTAGDPGLPETSSRRRSAFKPQALSQGIRCRQSSLIQRPAGGDRSAAAAFYPGEITGLQARPQPGDLVAAGQAGEPAQRQRGVDDRQSAAWSGPAFTICAAISWVLRRAASSSSRVNDLAWRPPVGAPVPRSSGHTNRFG